MKYPIKWCYFSLMGYFLVYMFHYVNITPYISFHGVSPYEITIRPDFFMAPPLRCPSLGAQAKLLIQSDLHLSDLEWQPHQ